MSNNESKKWKSPIPLVIVIGVVVLIFLIVYKLFYCPNGCTILGVRYCPCPYNLNKLPATIEELKATREQLKEVPEQFRQVPEKLGKMIEELEDTRTE